MSKIFLFSQKDGSTRFLLIMLIGLIRVICRQCPSFHMYLVKDAFTSELEKYPLFIVQRMGRDFSVLAAVGTEAKSTKWSR